MKKLRNILAPFLFVFLIASPIMAVATPLPATVSAACDDRVLGFPPWYKGLTSGAKCEIAGPDVNDENGLRKFITKIIVNIIEIGLVLVGYIAVFFILFGGFQFLTGGSNPAQIEKARKSILNAVIGLAIAIGAIAIVNLLIGRIIG